MKLEQIRVPLIPRTTVNCFDLGALFYGRHLPAVMAYWLAFAAPSVLITYLFASAGSFHFVHAALLVFFVSGPFGVVLAQRTAQSAFGGSFAGPLPSGGKRRMWGLIIKTLLARAASLAGLMLFILPGWWVAVRYSFLVEKTALKDLEGRSNDRRTEELIRQELGALMQRTLGIVLLLGGVYLVTFHMLDNLSSTLFDTPLFWGRVFNDASQLWPDDWLEVAFDYAVYDPLVLSLEVAVALLVYPLARFAWFFCYIDLRVRGDFWDLELRFHREVERLGEVY